MMSMFRAKQLGIPAARWGVAVGSIGFFLLYEEVPQLVMQTQYAPLMRTATPPFPAPLMCSPPQVPSPHLPCTPHTSHALPTSCALPTPPCAVYPPPGTASSPDGLGWVCTWVSSRPRRPKSDLGATGGVV